MTETREPTQLMLVAEAGPGAAERLAAAFGAAPIASVVIAPGEGKALEAQAVTGLVAQIQKTGAAALIAGDARLARTVKADGVHIPVSETAEALYEEAREVLGRRFVVGCDVGRSRHDAMVIGEAEADYIGFGIPAFVKDRETATERRLELIAWWAEIFEVPCVAFDVATAEEAAELADAGADFVAITLAGGGETPADIAAHLKRFAAAIAPSEAQA